MQTKREVGYRLQDIIPVIGFGTWKITGKACAESTQHALEIGYRHLDTAQAYNNEEEVGRGIRNSGVDRDEIFLTTKIATPNLHPAGISGSTINSLMRLKTEYLDLLLIHWPIKEMDLKACLESMQELQEREQVRYIGVSNFNPELFKEALDIAPILTNQIRFSPYHQEMENLNLAKARDICITAYSPLDEGDIEGKGVLAGIAEKHNKSAAQVSLRWLVQLGHMAVIPKAAHAAHRIENLEIFDFELSENEMEEIQGLPG